MVVHLFGTLTPGNMFTFNTNDGYLEALIRGFRSGILTTSDYANLIQCYQLEGITLFPFFSCLERHQDVRPNQLLWRIIGAPCS